MNLDVIEFERISELITIGKLEAHQSNRDEEIETKADTVELGLYIQGFIIELPVLPKEVKEGLIADEIPVFQASIIVKIGGERVLIEAPHGIPASETV